jgi:UrcA family protein
MSHFVKRALLGAGSLAAALSFGAVNAATPEENPPSMVVKYSAQDLNTQSGLNQLYHRLARAAIQVCPEASSFDLSQQAKVAKCRDQALARAIRQIDNAQLAALYAASHSKSS